MSGAGDERMKDFPPPPEGEDWRLQIDPRPCDDCGPRGEQGDKGDVGESGPPGKIPAPIRAAFAYLFMLMFLLIGLSFAGIWYYVHENNQQRCGGISQQVAIPVPVPTADNPSREWVARFSAIERQRGKELGCHMPPPRFVTQPGH